MTKTLVSSAVSALLVTAVATSSSHGQAPRESAPAAASFCRAGHLSGRLDDRVRQRRRHLGSAGARRRCAAAGVAPGDGIASAVFARRQAAGVHLDAHRRRRRLRPDARDRRPDAPDLRRCERAGDRMVGGRQVGLLPVEQPRRVRACSTCIASTPTGGTPMPVGGRSLHDRVLRRAVAGRRRAGDHGARQRRVAVVAQRATAISTRARSGWSRTAAPARPRSTTGHQGRREGRVADVEPPAAKALYFMSDRSGAQNIWSVSSLAVQGADAGRREGGDDVPRRAGAVAVHHRRTARRSRSSATSASGRSTRRRARRARCRSRCAARRRPPAIEHRTFSDQFQELALSPDGKKVAFTVHGEIFSASAKDGGDATRITDRPPARRPSWPGRPTAGDLAASSDRDGTHHIVRLRLRHRQRDAADHRHRAATTCRAISPDGKWIAFERDSQELRVVDPVTKADTLVATGVFDTPPFVDSRDFAWSPDSRFIAYLTAGAKTFQNVARSRRSAGGGERRPVSFLANTNAGLGVVESRRHAT